MSNRYETISIRLFFNSVSKRPNHPSNMFGEPFSFFSEAQFSSLWNGQPCSFQLGDPSSMPFSTAQHSSSSSSAAIQQQTDYLRSLTEDQTAENFHVNGLGQSTPRQLNMFPDQMGPILEAITRDPTPSIIHGGDSTATTLGSLGMVSGDPSFYVPALTVNGQLCPTEQTIVANAGIITSSRPVTDGDDYPSSYAVTESGVNDLVGISPFNGGTDIDINRYLIPDLEVEFCGLENRVFEKQQSRKDKQARQRIINGKVKFLIRSESQVRNVKAWVRREEKAALLEKDVNGMVELEAIFLRKLNESGSVSAILIKINFSDHQYPLGL